MTIESQAVLRGIKNMTGNMSEEFGYLTNSTCFQTDHGARYDFARYKGEIQSIVDQLLDEGYIKQSSRRYYFVLTQKAIHMHEERMERLRNFLIRSVVVPVSVSIVTSLIVLWLQGLL